jgi:hypothetical protein
LSFAIAPMNSLHPQTAPVRPRRERLVAILVTVALVLPGGIGLALYLTWFQEPHGLATDGPTFYQAIAGVNGSVSTQPGGPWTLFGVWGIASPVPFAPNSLGWIGNNKTVNDCGAEFNGLTLWNGSIPIFTGVFESGTAPFWQFAYFSNSSHGLLVATNVLGVAHVYTPISMSDPCAVATGLGATPWVWARIFTQFPTNSPVMAASAWAAIGEHWSALHAPGFEAYILGFGYWGSANPNGFIVKFARCGEMGYAGVQPFADVVLSPNGNWDNYANGTQGCGNVMSLGPPPVYAPYVLEFATPTVKAGTGTTTVNQSFQTGYAGTNDFDAGGLVSWMSSLNLTNSVGQAVQSVVPACSGWVHTLANCSATGSGWYAVLLSSSGKWLDSYPSTPNGTTWEIPNVSIVSNQYLVVVVPSSWNISGDVFSIHGTVPVVTVEGSTTL